MTSFFCHEKKNGRQRRQLHQAVVELGGLAMQSAILAPSSFVVAEWIEKELIATQKQKWMLGERRTRLALFYDGMTGVLYTFMIYICSNYIISCKTVQLYSCVCTLSFTCAVLKFTEMRPS